MLAFVIVLFTQTLAQDKVFTYGDYMNWDLYPESIQNLAWRGETQFFTYVENNALIQKSAKNPEAADTLFKLDDLKSKVKGADLEDLKRFPRISWLNSRQFYFTNDQHIFLFDFDSDEVKQVNSYPEDAENVEIEKENFSVAYTLKNNLYVSISGEQIAVSQEENEDILFGHVPSRNEFGISQGSFWSPKGDKLAFYFIDQTEVEDYPLVDIFHRMAKPDPISYPMAGQKSQQVKVGVFNPSVNQIVFIRTPGPQNQYLTSVSWGPAGKYLYIGLLNRDQNHLEMNKYDASSGKLIKTLFEEENERYVEPSNPLHFLSTKPDQFLWQSRRDGWNHLYLYNTDGNLIKQVTKGSWEVTGLLGFDVVEKWVYYSSTAASPIERQVYKTDISKGKTVQITNTKGTHSVSVSENMEFFLDVFSSTEMARAYYLLDGDGEIVSTLKEDQNPWSEYKTGEMEIFTLKADDGKTDLFCRVIKPTDFDPAKKYPALVYVYGGPHAQLITNSWTGGAGFWLNLMAQQGYVVFTLDNRGSANRGFEFESIIHRQCGEKEIADQMTGVEYLKSLDYVDADRIGVDGWSYGGFLTTSLFLRNPDVFKVACAGGPVIDWKWYEAMYGERYMDTPMQNPDGYEKANVLNYVDQLQGKLLLIHGTNDPVVMWQNSLTFLDECVKHGKQVDYFVYPGAGHNMRGQARVHMFEKITSYFNENLK
jgi:dipeptidyl-peptidase-4